MRRLFAAASLAPLMFAAQGALSAAQAQVTISTATTAPLVTSTSGDVTVAAAGSVTVPEGAAITIDSSNLVKVDGTVSVRGSQAGTGILVTVPAAGLNSGITVSGSILADDLLNNVDLDKDGDLDGVFVNTGVVRYGIRVQGAGGYVGDITQSAGQINLEGNDGSAAISIETPMFGNLLVRGGIGVVGSKSYGVHVTGPFTGNITLGPSQGLVLSVQGEGAVAAAIDADVTGRITIDGQLRSSGFRYLSRTDIPIGLKLENLDADDLLIGGPALRIAGNVTGGLIIDAPPPNTDDTNSDEDGDGVPDDAEGTGGLNSLGSAPALLIGSASNIALGNVGTGQFDSFGLVVRGQIVGQGLFDGINGVALQIGGLGGTVDTGGGIYVRSTISGSGVLANAVGISLKAGAIVPTILVDGGTIRGGALGSATFTPTVRALSIEEGAHPGQLNNGGFIEASVNGPSGNIVTVEDKSGELSLISNTGRVSATILTGDIEVAPIGQRIAFDLRANKTGVTLGQFANANNPDFIPSINGDILLSAGDLPDNVAFIAGRTNGAISFGGGADNFLVGEGASSLADVRKTSGDFAIGVAGVLTFTNTNALAVTKLQVNETGGIGFSADPKNADPSQRVTQLKVSGDAIFAAGSRIALQFKSKIVDPTTYTVLTAGNLVNGGVDTSLLNSLPLVFKGDVSVANNQINIAVRRREASELGLTGGRAQAYNAFYAAFDTDPAVAAAVLAKTTNSDFNKLYDQFLPDYSGGPFNSLANGTRAVMQAEGEEPKGLIEGEPRSWLQEVGVGVKHESVNDIEYQTAGLGLAGGFEKPIGAHGAYGVAGSFMSSEIRNAQRAIGSVLTANTILSSVYWRGKEDGLVMDASMSGGYAWFRSTRRIVDQDANGAQNLVREPKGDWGGALASARVGVAYNWEAGPFYIRHDATLDAVYLAEQSYTETGGGPAANLMIGRRENYEAAAEAGVLMGATFGRSFRWGPEIRVAYRGLIDGGEGDTVGRFVSSPGSPFSLPGLVKDNNRIIVRAAIRGSGAYANFALEASGDIGELYQAYMARVLIRFLF